MSRGWSWMLSREGNLMLSGIHLCKRGLSSGAILGVSPTVKRLVDGRMQSNLATQQRRLQGSSAGQRLGQSGQLHGRTRDYGPALGRARVESSACSGAPLRRSDQP